MKFFKDSLIILLITLGLFLCCELFLRFAVNRYNNQPSNLAYEFNKDYLVSLKPNIKKSYRRTSNNGNNLITWQSNADGFRGKELQASPDIRIIVYGDSMIQARFSELKNTYTQKLEKYLKDKTKQNIEVINAGVIGMGPDQNLIRLKKDIKKYKPNIVIFSIFTDNDFGDIIRNRLFELDEEDNLVETKHKTTIDELLKPKTKNSLKDYVSSLLTIKYAKRLLEKNFTNEKEQEATSLKRICSAEMKIYKNKEEKKYSHFADHYDFDLATEPQTKDSQIKIKLMEAVLKEVKKETQKQNTKLIVLNIPSIKDITDQNVPLDYKELSKFPNYKQNNLTNIVEEICDRNKIEHINLYKVFKDSNPNDLFFNGDNNHWTNKGQDLAANHSADYINR